MDLATVAVESDRVSVDPEVSPSDVACSAGHIPEISVPINVPPPPHLLSVNSHPKVTRSKVRISKPKALTVEITELEPRMSEEAFAIEECHAAAQAEYDALIRNLTWELVPLSPR